MLWVLIAIVFVAIIFDIPFTFFRKSKSEHVYSSNGAAVDKIYQEINSELYRMFHSENAPVYNRYYLNEGRFFKKYKEKKARFIFWENPSYSVKFVNTNYPYSDYETDALCCREEDFQKAAESILISVKHDGIVFAELDRIMTYPGSNYIYFKRIITPDENNIAFCLRECLPVKFL